MYSHERATRYTLMLEMLRFGMPVDRDGEDYDEKVRIRPLLERVQEAKQAADLFLSLVGYKPGDIDREHEESRAPAQAVLASLQGAADRIAQKQAVPATEQPAADVTLFSTDWYVGTMSVAFSKVERFLEDEHYSAEVQAIARNALRRFVVETKYLMARAGQPEEATTAPTLGEVELSRGLDPQCPL